MHGSAHNRGQRGFTLVEMMVSIMLGLFLTGAVIHVTIVSNRNFAQDEAIARMQENARFAMREIVRDLSMMDFWGQTLDPVDVDTSGMTAPDANDDCGPGTPWMYEVGDPLEFLVEATSTQVIAAYQCIEIDEIKADTDILAVKRLAGRSKTRPHADDSDDEDAVYFRVDGQGGDLVVFDAATAPVGAIDWQYLVNVYHIMPNSDADEDDGVPTLYRKTMQVVGGTRMMDTEEGGVAQGIEYFHVEYGIDPDANGIPEYYVSSPSATELDDAVTARVWVLARAMQPDTSYLNENVYQMGNITWDVASKNGGTGDHFRRLLVSTTTKMRNPANRQLLDL